MGSFKDVTPAEIEAAYQEQRRRFPIYNEAAALEASVVMRPDLAIRGWSGWLCKVCRRVPLPNRQPWSWLGCETCRVVDARGASLFGGSRILPLGQHSIMNGAGIRLSTPDGPGLDAKFDQFVALGRGWEDLSRWAALEGLRLAATVSEADWGESASVSLASWREWFPSGPIASADAFTRLIAQQQPWLADMEPRVGDVDWLAEVGRYE